MIELMAWIGTYVVLGFAFALGRAAGTAIAGKVIK